MEGQSLQYIKSKLKEYMTKQLSSFDSSFLTVTSFNLFKVLFIIQLYGRKSLFDSTLNLNVKNNNSTSLASFSGLIKNEHKNVKNVKKLKSIKKLKNIET